MPAVTKHEIFKYLVHEADSYQCKASRYLQVFLDEAELNNLKELGKWAKKVNAISHCLIESIEGNKPLPKKELKGKTYFHIPEERSSQEVSDILFEEHTEFETANIEELKALQALSLALSQSIEFLIEANTYQSDGEKLTSSQRKGIASCQENIKKIQLMHERGQLAAKRSVVFTKVTVVLFVAATLCIIMLPTGLVLSTLMILVVVLLLGFSIYFGSRAAYLIKRSAELLEAVKQDPNQGYLLNEAFKKNVKAKTEASYYMLHKTLEECGKLRSNEFEEYEDTTPLISEPMPDSKVFTQIKTKGLLQLIKDFLVV